MVSLIGRWDTRTSHVKSPCFVDATFYYFVECILAQSSSIFFSCQSVWKYHECSYRTVTYLSGQTDFCMYEWNCLKLYLVVQPQYNAMYLCQVCCTTGTYQGFYVRMEYIETATSCIFNSTTVQCSVFIPGMLLYHTRVCTRYRYVVTVVTRNRL